MKPKIKKYSDEYLKRVMNPADFVQWLKLKEKGERLGAMVQNPNAKGMHSDATRGMKKLSIQKCRLLKKYGLET